jgi:DnaK suppressor protein
MFGRTGWPLDGNSIEDYAVAKKVSSKKTSEKPKKAGKASAARPAPTKARKVTRPVHQPYVPPQPPAKPALTKSPLSKPELKEFRTMLLEKRRSIIGDMNGMENEALRTNRQDNSGDLSLMPDHPANIATDNFEQEFTLGLIESERTMLREINEALERIDAGTYGICLGTGQAIGKARLLARPWAKYCIEYARLIEKGLVRIEESSSSDEDHDEDFSPSIAVDDEEIEVEEEIPDSEE